jgi:hypothetical protein
MITDHTGVNKSASELVTKLKVKPEDNPTSESLKKGGEDNVAKLTKLKGAEFDRAYVDNELTYHQTVLDALDKTLIPNAKNEELKALMVKVRPAFVAHLEHAKQLQASLAKSGGSSVCRNAPARRRAGRAGNRLQRASGLGGRTAPVDSHRGDREHAVRAADADRQGW